MTNPFKTPAPTFDDPLEMLIACHGRIQHQCTTLVKLARHLPDHGADAQAQQAATNILRYFDSAAQHHHEDEEKDLFPVLRRVASASEASATNQLIDALLRDHQMMHRAWAALRNKLIQIAAGETAKLSVDEAETFTRLYADHITREEGELLPLAKRLLSTEQTATLGRSMSHRRGAKV